VSEPAALSHGVDERPSLLGIGVIIWLASDVLFFGALFASYFTLRSQTAVWPTAGADLPVLRALVFTLILVASSFTMERALAGVQRRRARMVTAWLAGTIFLGVVFAAGQIVDYYRLPFEISTDAYGTMYYLMTGFHLLHVGGGVFMMTLLLIMGGRLLVARTTWLQSMSYYWHFVDIVWVVLFLVIFVLQ
jgi:cytochrome c oxidase subunit III